MKRFLTAVFTCIAFLWVGATYQKVQAQVSAYTYSSSSGTYTAIAAGTLLGSTASDDQRFVDPAVPLGGTATTGVGFPIGFNFTYNTVVFDRVAINNNGWISLGQSALTPAVDIASSSSYTPLSSTATNTPSQLRSRIAGIAADLQGQTGSELRIQTIGTTPNQVCVIQWTNYRRYVQTGMVLNFQIRLNETSNTVDIVYGSNTFNATTNTAHVGLGGSAATDFNNRLTTAPHDWNATSAGVANTSSCTFVSTGTPPVSGLTFTWTPPVGTPPPGPSTPSSPADSATNVATNSSLNWNLPVSGGSPTGYKLFFGTDNPPTNIVNGTNLGNVLTYTPSPVMTVSTLYFWKIVPTNAGGDASGCPVWRFTTGPDPTITSFPYAEGFEGTFPPYGWTNNSATPWNRSSGNAYAGTYDAHITYNHTGNSILTSPPVNLPANFRIIWWWKDADASLATTKAGEKTNGKEAVKYSPLIVGHDTTFFEISTNGGTTWLTTDTLSAASAQTTWSQKIRDLSAYAGNNFRFRFRDWSDGTFSAYGSGVDSIRIEVNPVGPPNCAGIVGPADLAANVQIADSLRWSAPISGSSPTGYRLYFGTDNPPTNIVNGTNLGLVLSYNPSPDMLYSTTYFWKVVPTNAGGDATGCPIWSFTTGPDPTITSFPYAEGFEGTTFAPYGWTNTSTGTSTALWNRVTSGQYSGGGGARITYSHNGTSTLTSPPINLPAGHRITFWWKDNDIFVANDRPNSKGDNGKMNPTVPPYDTTYFEISTNGGTSWTTLSFLSAASPQSAYVQEIQDLSAYAGSGRYVRWRDRSDGTGGAYGTGLDSIRIEVLPVGPPNCAGIVGPANLATNVQIADSLRWSAPGSGGPPTGYKLYFGTDNPPTNIVNGTNLGLVLSYNPTPDMLYSTIYYWKVVPTNGSGDASGCVVDTFTTQSNPNYGGGGGGSGGYYFANSTAGASGAPSQPVYSWIDPIAGGHTAITAWTTGTGDDGTFTVPAIGFVFTYFGNPFQISNVFIGANGLLTFGAAPSGYGSATFPNVATPNNVVAGCWMDLDTRSTNYPAAAVYYGGDASKFVVSWMNVHKYGSATDSITFQIILYSNGNIKMQYNDLKTTIPLPASINDDLIAGIENSDGTLGIGYRVNGVGGPVISSPVAVEFGTNVNALPIVLSSFTGHVNSGGTVRIDWTTTSEINNYGFYVQRRLTGTVDWSTVSSLIPGFGTTLQPHSYSFVDNTISTPGSYQYRLRQMDLDGTAHHVDPITIVVGTTDVKELAPREFSLKQNYPNPFNPETIVKFSVENTARATLDVYNVLGQKVASLFDGIAEAGQYYNVRLNGSSLATGMYIYKLQSGTRTDVKKMLLLK